MEKQWSLESFDTDGKHVVFVITQLPCRIGRGKESDLHISNLGLSRAHAVLIRDISGQLRLIDENSTNGTFVNRHRVDGYCLLNENDIIHFASAEFKLRLRLVEQNTALPFDEMHTLLMPKRIIQIPDGGLLGCVVALQVVFRGRIGLVGANGQ